MIQSDAVFSRLDVLLKPDPSRTVVRPFGVDYPPAFADGRDPRVRVVVQRVLSLEPAERRRLLGLMLPAMRERHRGAEAIFLRRFEEISGEVGGLDVDHEQQVLIGAYFSQEYAFESAALFNPSIVTLPEEEQTVPDATGFLLSLRGIGEGHISSVTFRTGTWAQDGSVEVDTPSPHGVPPRVVRPGNNGGEDWVRLECEDSEDISETVIFPVLPSQRQGVEDVRLVRFTDHDGTESVIGTYTAYDGKDARQEMLRGIDLRTFEMRPLEGRMTGYKGMALFPRRIGGRFVMLGRQDSENIWLLRSDDLHHWDAGDPIMAPKYPWEFVQLGNCGSPLEVDEGWLVFTHGVGMVRGYSIGACLLDKHDPSIVLKRTPEPLLYPSAEQRGGYVPNVTYGCGALLRGRDVLLPYAIGDEVTTFARGTVDDILGAMVSA